MQIKTKNFKRKAFLIFRILYICSYKVFSKLEILFICLIISTTHFTANDTLLRHFVFVANLAIDISFDDHKRLLTNWKFAFDALKTLFVVRLALILHPFDA